jgi:hypothetical protein
LTSRSGAGMSLTFFYSVASLSKIKCKNTKLLVQFVTVCPVYFLTISSVEPSTTARSYSGILLQRFRAAHLPNQILCIAHSEQLIYQTKYYALLTQSSSFTKPNIMYCSRAKPNITNGSHVPKQYGSHDSSVE